MNMLKVKQVNEKVQKAIIRLETATAKYETAYAENATSVKTSKAIISMKNAQQFLLDKLIEYALLSKKSYPGVTAQFEQIKQRARLNPTYLEQVLETLLNNFVVI